MALTPGNADALAADICTELGVSDTVSKNKYKKIYEIIYVHLLADIQATLTAGTVVTTGSATTQTGPAADVPVIIS